MGVTIGIAIGVLLGLIVTVVAIDHAFRDRY